MSLDLNALCEFALHAKVEKPVVEGKGKLSVIKSIRRKIEDSVESLSDDDQIEFVDGLTAHLGPPPLEGMEDQYGQEELENKGDLKKLKKKLNELESKQQLVEEQLAKMQKEKLPDPVRDESTIKFSVKEVEQSIFYPGFQRTFFCDRYFAAKPR